MVQGGTEGWYKVVQEGATRWYRRVVQEGGTGWNRRVVQGGTGERAGLGHSYLREGDRVGSSRECYANFLAVADFTLSVRCYVVKSSGLQAGNCSSEGSSPVERGLL